MSLILNFETSSKNCSVTLSSEGKLISNFDLEDDKYRHSELLTSTIKDILTQNSISAKELSAVAIGIGPGSFTGLRIGFSVAKGLCFPHKINLIGISSLKILANSIKNDIGDIIPMINDKVKLQYKPISSTDMIDLSYASFKEQKFEDLAYFEPLYLKKPYVT